VENIQEDLGDRVLKICQEQREIFLKSQRAKSIQAIDLEETLEEIHAFWRSGAMEEIGESKIRKTPKGWSLKPDHNV
jgi:hypothetical protein